jgi:ATP-dependent Clp protease, protease subunit
MDPEIFSRLDGQVLDGRSLDVYARLLKERIVFLGTQVDDTVANLICAQLLLLESEDPERDVFLYINSPGGSVTAGMAIYDTMQYVQSPIATYGVGQAISVGAVLLAAGTQGRRAILPHARVVLHQPAGRSQGTIPDLILQADEVVRVRGQVEEILARHTGQTVERLRHDTDRDHVLTAEGAKTYGIVDHVIAERAPLAALA